MTTMRQSIRGPRREGRRDRPTLDRPVLATWLAARSNASRPLGEINLYFCQHVARGKGRCIRYLIYETVCPIVSRASHGYSAGVTLSIGESLPVTYSARAGLAYERKPCDQYSRPSWP